MKQLITILCAVLSVITASAQQPDKPLVKVQYAFTHIRDTTNRDKPYTETMLLFAGKNATLYISYDKLAYRIQAIKEMKEAFKLMAPGQTHITITKPAGSAVPRKTTLNEYYFFHKEHKLFTKEQINWRYMVEDEFPVMNWQILKDTLSFSGIHCQKAITTFKGRKWTAWFTPGMPFQGGPWKLNGLPGLIIEAYDDKKEIQFKFEGIEKIPEGVKPNDQIPGGEITEIVLPVNDGGAMSRVSRKEFERLKAAEAKDPEGFADAENISRGMGAPTGPPRKAYVPPPGPVINNPIELPEK